MNQLAKETKTKLKYEFITQFVLNGVQSKQITNGFHLANQAIEAWNKIEAEIEEDFE